jgi:hypothetical protein
MISKQTEKAPAVRTIQETEKAQASAELSNRELDDLELALVAGGGNGILGKAHNRPGGNANPL